MDETGNMTAKCQGCALHSYRQALRLSKGLRKAGWLGDALTSRCEGQTPLGKAGERPQGQANLLVVLLGVLYELGYRLKPCPALLARFRQVLHHSAVCRALNSTRHNGTWTCQRSLGETGQRR